MTARLEVGDENFVIDQGEIRPLDDNPVAKARAAYLNGTAAMWVDEARREGKISYYDPDHDCTMATVIARRIHGRAKCETPPAVPRGTTF